MINYFTIYLNERKVILYLIWHMSRVVHYFKPKRHRILHVQKLGVPDIRFHISKTLQRSHMLMWGKRISIQNCFQTYTTLSGITRGFFTDPIFKTRLKGLLFQHGHLVGNKNPFKLNFIGTSLWNGSVDYSQLNTRLLYRWYGHNTNLPVLSLFHSQALP